MFGYLNKLKEDAIKLKDDAINSSTFQNVTEAMKTNAEGMVTMIKETMDPEINFDINQMGLYRVSERVFSMGFPSEEDEHFGMGRQIDQLSKWLTIQHKGHFMIWNLANQTYDYSKFENHVIDVKHVPFPIPPLDQLLSTCNSIHGWLREDDANIAAIHCTTGKGKTLVAITIFLAWAGYVESPKAGIELICSQRKVKAETLLNPTQLRYVAYATWIMEEQYPSVKPITLERVIFNGIPSFEDGGCRPELQIFCGGQLVFSDAEGSEAGSGKAYKKEDSSVLFPVGKNLEGDIFIRVRHVSKDDKKTVMLRFGFHTGFMRPGNSRFVLQQMDGACTDERFPKDFFLDLIFRTSLDEDGNEVQGAVATDYWATISKKPSTKVSLDFKKNDGATAAAAAATTATTSTTTTAAASSSSSSVVATKTTKEASASGSEKAPQGGGTGGEANDDIENTLAELSDPGENSDDERFFDELMEEDDENETKEAPEGGGDDVLGEDDDDDDDDLLNELAQLEAS